MNTVIYVEISFTGAFLDVRHSVLFISNKFCDLSLRHCMHCYKTFRRIPPPSPDDAGLILLGRGK
jgi:hypothetical protein